MPFLAQDNPRLKAMKTLQDKLRAHATRRPGNYHSIVFPARSGKHCLRLRLRGNTQMGNQNPSEVHGPIRASNYRSHTSCLNASLSTIQPALWVFHLLYTLFPFQLPQCSGLGSPSLVPSGQDRTEHPGTARAPRLRLQTAPPVRQQVPEPRLAPTLSSEKSRRGMLITPHFVRFRATPRCFPSGKGGPAAPPLPHFPVAAHLRLHGLHLYPFP